MSKYKSDFYSRKASYAGAIVGGLVLFLCLVCASVVFTLNFRPLYYLDMKLLHISEQSGFDSDVIRRNYDVLIAYNNIWHSGALEFVDFTMSESGRIHFEEVKKVFAIFEYGALILIVVSAALVIRAKRKHSYRIFAAAGAFSIGIPAGLGILIAANWEWVFITFHRLVFRNDYWLFDPSTDPVIQILPDAFFMHCAALILLLILAGSAGFFIAWKKGEGKKDRKKEIRKEIQTNRKTKMPSGH